MNSADVRIVKAVRSAHLLPQDYLDGMLEVRALVTHGSDTIDLLGRPYTAAPWFYFPLTTTIKFTVPFLAMLALGGAGLFAMGRDRKREILFVLLPALLFLALSTRMQRTAAGIWHLFPMLPFLLIVAGAGCVYLARRYRWAGGVLVCLLVLHAVSSLRAYPNYLSYANELWGGPQNLPKHLPWTDLNQTYWEVSRYMEQHPNTPCWVSSNWLVPVSKYNAPCTMIGNHSETDLPLRMKGIVFVSSSWLQVYGHPGTPLSPFYSIFHGVEPKARLGGGAVLVYEGEFDTHIAAATILDDRILRLLRSRINPAAILPPAEKLVEFEPTSFRSHDLYCIALTANRNVRQAFGECTIALRLAKADPLTLPAVPGITQQLNVLSQLNGAPLGM